KQWFEPDINEGTFDFKFAFSAEEAIDYLRTAEYADLVLILSDINMPGMNGIELLKIIKEKYPKMTVMIITAYGDEYTYNIAMKHGADGFFEKPLDLQTLRDKILKYRQEQKS